MTPEERAAEKQRRSAEAKKIVESWLFIETMAALHDTFLAAWRQAPENSNQNLREQLYKLDQAAFKFERLLTAALAQGINQVKLDLAKLQNAPQARTDGVGESRRT